MTDVSRSQQFDNRVLGTVATPVVLFIWTYFGYVLKYFRGGSSTEDGPPIKGHLAFQLSESVRKFGSSGEPA